MSIKPQRLRQIESTKTLLARWPGAVGEMFRCLETKSFPVALQRAISVLTTFDAMIVARYQGTSRPHTLYHDLDEVQATINLSFYESGPYLLDPFFLACLTNIEPGAYRLMSLAPEAFSRSEYYRTFYRRIHISDEMGLLIHEKDDRWIIVSLARNQRRPKFNDNDVEAVNAVFEILSAAVLRHWGNAAESDNQANDPGLQDRLLSFGRDKLSPREVEIVHLILLGHSTPSVATCLGIAEGTVKVHRRHAYAKLAITSQAELFSLATRYLSGAPGSFGPAKSNSTPKNNV